MLLRFHTTLVRPQYHCSSITSEAHPVDEQIERLLRGEVVPLQQRPFLLEERVAGPDRRCQLKLVVRVLLRDNACRRSKFSMSPAALTTSFPESWEWRRHERDALQSAP